MRFYSENRNNHITLPLPKLLIFRESARKNHQTMPHHITRLQIYLVITGNYMSILSIRVPVIIQLGYAYKMLTIQIHQ